jgi:hypothetical protein
MAWVHSATESDWTGESAILNGRRFYSFRGASTGALDYYDIPSNSWVSTIGPTPSTETLTTGTKWVYNGNYLYFQKDQTGRWFRYDVVRNMVDGWGTMTYTQGAAVLGDTAFDAVYKDGATEITYIYMLLNTSNVLLRQMVI